ncbi:MAG TPA: hypothetical protein VHR15_20970 [Ktedonobacterales bacterium]|nr:hypothetical protein [Ktedonobacterales bacterium]
MDSMSRIKDQLPERYATLADTPRVMGEASDSLADLHSATLEVGKALIDAGLPKPVWRSEQATLRLLSTTLPNITVDAYLARLEQFATRDGPTWLHGAHDDLAAFHKEVAVLAQVTRPLREVVQRLQRLPVEMPGGPRSDHPLQRVVRDPHLEPPLNTIAEILNDLEALAPFMRPLTPEQWRALQSSSRLSPARIWTALTVWVNGLRSRGSAASSPATMGAAKPNAFLGASRAWVSQRLSWLRSRTRAQRALLAAGVLVVVAVFVALALSRLPHASGLAPTASSSAVRTVLAGSGTATALATTSPASTSTSATTPGPAPKLTGACKAHGATATLTLKNTGVSPFTWQAQPPPTLTVSPTQGVLQAGESATVQVSAVNKKNASGTITVVASHDTVSTQNKVSCR